MPFKTAFKCCRVGEAWDGVWVGVLWGRLGVDVEGWGRVGARLGEALLRAHFGHTAL